jgi:hypothetical protein
MNNFFDFQKAVILKCLRYFDIRVSNFLGYLLHKYLNLCNTDDILAGFKIFVCLSICLHPLNSKTNHEMTSRNCAITVDT